MRSPIFQGKHIYICLRKHGTARIQVPANPQCSKARDRGRSIGSIEPEELLKLLLDIGVCDAAHHLRAMLLAKLLDRVDHFLLREDVVGAERLVACARGVRQLRGEPAKHHKLKRTAAALKLADDDFEVHRSSFHSFSFVCCYECIMLE